MKPSKRYYTKGTLKCEVCAAFLYTKHDPLYPVCDKCDLKQYRSQKLIPPFEHFSGRRCVKCAGRLEATRYFECDSCTPTLPEEDELAMMRGTR